MERSGRQLISTGGLTRLFGHCQVSIERLVDGGLDRVPGAELGEYLSDSSRTASMKPFDLAAECDVRDDVRDDRRG